MTLSTKSMKNVAGEMTVKILRETRAGGKRVRVGDIVTIRARDARLLINIGKAEEAEKPKAAKEKATPKKKAAAKK